ncbi:hypothetical protein ACFLTU_02715 [Bacteroidota bacterium]
MKKNLFIIGFLLLLGNFSAFSQLSDRVNNASTMTVGTRPIDGNLGIYFGISAREISDLINDAGYVYTGIPLISLKYYTSDKRVLRMGIQVKKKSLIESGTVDPAVDPSNLTERVSKEITSDFLLTPGFEHHFTNSNLIDVYAGGLLPVGWARDVYKFESTYNNRDFSYYTRTKTGIVFGWELFVGLQAFIADLPLAIGFDLGISGLGEARDKYKHELSTKVGAATTDQVYYTVDAAALGILYEDLSSRNFEVEGNIRVTLSYFFSK